MSELTFSLTASLPAASASGAIAVPTHFTLNASFPIATAAGVIETPAQPTVFSVSAAMPIATVSGRLKRVGYGRSASVKVSYDANAVALHKLIERYGAESNPINVIPVGYQSSLRLNAAIVCGYDQRELFNLQYQATYKMPDMAATSSRDAWEFWQGTRARVALTSLYGRITDKNDLTLKTASSIWFNSRRISELLMSSYDAANVSSVQLSSDYSSPQRIIAVIDAVYGSRASSMLGIDASYDSSAVFVQADSDYYDDSFTIFSSYDVVYTDFSRITKSVIAEYSGAGALNSESIIVYDKAICAHGQLTGRYAHTNNVSSIKSSSYAFLTRDKHFLSTTVPATFEIDIKAVFAKRSTSSIKTSRGVIDPIKLQVSTSISENVWQVSADIAPNQLPLAVINDAVSVEIAGMTFAAVISGKSMSRSASSVTLSIDAFSVGKALATTKAQAVTATNSSAALIALGIDRIIDLPSAQINSLSTDNQSVLSIASSIANDMGAVVVSRPNGSLSVIPDYRATGAAWVVDESDILELQESFVDGVGYNLVVVSDGASSKNNMQTEVVDDGGNWLLYVYGVDRASVTHTQSNAVIMSLGKRSIVKTAQVEFVDGIASVTYPIQSIVSVDWLANAAGSVAVDGNQLRAGSAGSYGLADITYRVNPLVYRIIYNKNEPIQLIIKEV